MTIAILLAFLLGVLTLVLGTSALVVLWPVAAISWAALYCLDKPVRRAAWPIVLLVMLGGGLVYDIGGWSWTGSGLANLILFGAPLVVAVLLVAVCGGPARIKERHAQADARRRMLRQAAVAHRRQLRKERIREKTGVDVGLLGEVTRDRAGRVTKSLGSRVNRRLEKRRPAGSEPAGPPQWLDLDKDVAPDLSKQQRQEILDLADQLEKSRPRPRPQ